MELEKTKLREEFDQKKKRSCKITFIFLVFVAAFYSFIFFQ